MGIADNLKNKFGDNAGMLARLRDEIRLKIHLGSMELQDKWKDLEAKLPEVEKRAHQADVGSKAMVSDVIRQLMELKHKLGTHARDEDRPDVTH